MHGYTDTTPVARLRQDGIFSIASTINCRASREVSWFARQATSSQDVYWGRAASAVPRVIYIGGDGVLSGQDCKAVLDCLADVPHVLASIVMCIAAAGSTLRGCL